MAVSLRQRTAWLKPAALAERDELQIDARQHTPIGFFRFLIA